VSEFHISMEVPIHLRLMKNIRWIRPVGLAQTTCVDTGADCLFVTSDQTGEVILISAQN
jgi:hypothetical protein